MLARRMRLRRGVQRGLSGCCWAPGSRSLWACTGESICPDYERCRRSGSPARQPSRRVPVVHAAADSWKVSRRFRAIQGSCHVRPGPGAKETAVDRCRVALIKPPMRDRAGVAAQTGWTNLGKSTHCGRHTIHESPQPGGAQILSGQHRASQHKQYKRFSSPNRTRFGRPTGRVRRLRSGFGPPARRVKAMST
jgi:hypothetical protein